MAAYREHLTTSCVLGIGVASGAIAMEFTPVQGVLAGTITGIGGILPDLDSESGRPVREIFGVTAALAPLVMIRRLLDWGGNTDGAILLAVMLYVSVRYGGAMLLGALAVHRGMYHSIPAMLIAGELTFLGYKSEQISMKLLMAAGIMLGFFSHLLLDELYAVEWNGLRIKLNKFAGSAVKFVGKSWPGNIFAYGLLFMLTYSVWNEGGLRKGLEDWSGTKLAITVDPASIADPDPQIERPSEQKKPTTPTRVPTPPRSRPRPTSRLATQDEEWGGSRK